MIIVGNSTTPSVIDRKRQKSSKDIEKLNNTIKQLDLTDIYKKFFLQIAKYTFLSNPQRTFTKIADILRHKGNLKAITRIEIIQGMLFYHSGI